MKVKTLVPFWPLAWRILWPRVARCLCLLRWWAPHPRRGVCASEASECAPRLSGRTGGFGWGKAARSTTASHPYFWPRATLLGSCQRLSLLESIAGNLSKTNTHAQSVSQQVSRWSWDWWKWSVSLTDAPESGVTSLTHCWVREVGRCSYVPPQHQSEPHL